jgi:hypothetical protein
MMMKGDHFTKFHHSFCSNFTKEGPDSLFGMFTSPFNAGSVFVPDFRPNVPFFLVSVIGVPAF